MRVWQIRDMNVFVLLFILLLCVGYANCGYVDEEPVSANYDRFDEVRKACSKVVSTATELKFDEFGINEMKKELSFYNGDWEQQGTSAPLLPFVFDEGMSSGVVSDVDYDLDNSSYSKPPYKLVSFKLTDVSAAHRSKRAVGVNGQLYIVITSDFPMADAFHVKEADFSLLNGHTKLRIKFQGVYAESKKNGGERMLCLLGDTMLPSRRSDFSDPWESVKGSWLSNSQPPLLQDDQILLVLRYPKVVSLKRRAIQGEMRSLNSKTNLKYFDKVLLTSLFQVDAHKYAFADEVTAKACNPYPYPNTLLGDTKDVYTGLDFCATLSSVTSDAAFVVAPHWRCNGTDEFCRKLGPFEADKQINATDGGFKNVQILIQNILCLARKSSENAVVARVAATLRVFDALGNRLLESQRSGLNSMTLIAEGIWNSSSGQLCMLGCHGISDVEGIKCDSRICLYIPLLFTITQRSVLIGAISSTETTNPPYFPLSLEMLFKNVDYLYNSFRYSRPYYQYSKINDAGSVLEKYEPFSFGTVVKKSLLTFPQLQDSSDYLVSLRLLAEDFTLHEPAVSEDQASGSHHSRTDVQMEVLSLGPMFGRDWLLNSSMVDGDNPYHTKAIYTEKQLLLNVSTQLELWSGPYNNFSVLFLEGLYDQHVGKMYLIGCRDVRASWIVLFESMDLENGFDCLVEVVISYPPTTARWLVNPSATISISSRRPEDDLLYFKPIKLHTLPLLYRQQREDILSRRGFEGILRILTLSVAISCILGQLFYSQNITDYLPYISLVMLGSQILGYGLPLVIGAKALSGSHNSQIPETPSYDLEKSQWIDVIDYIVKLLVLVCFISTLRLCQKVWNSRVKLLSQHPDELHRVPSERRVLVITLIIHVLGYILALILHSAKTGQSPIQMDQYVDATGNPHRLKMWETLFQEYVGVLQDLFLLPQVIGNILWQINGRPLRKLYYIGITLVRLLPHVYDYIRGPISNPFFSADYEFVNQKFDFYNEFGDIAIPVLAVALVVLVYIQQRWAYDELCNALSLIRCRLLPLRSRVYERVPTQLVEAELVSAPNKNGVRESQE